MNKEIEEEVTAKHKDNQDEVVHEAEQIVEETQRQTLSKPFDMMSPQN